ncbi:hypothetical protein [Pseudomonas viridiflava]|uniref:hypothetical protein n=1 Tax=Pseudomonas viridiflava TaxID=33069 RepID=UPI0013CF0E1E|nr:hypothetical protein [Pseudomonas viridiflava]
MTSEKYDRLPQVGDSEKEPGTEVFYLRHAQFQQVFQPSAHAAFISTPMKFTWTLD